MSFYIRGCLNQGEVCTHTINPFPGEFNSYFNKIVTVTCFVKYFSFWVYLKEEEQKNIYILFISYLKV